MITQTDLRPRLWTWDFVLILLINSSISFLMFVQLTTLPSYVLRLGGGSAQAGLSTGIFTAAALLCRPLFGNLLDKTGRTVNLIIGSSIMVLVLALYNFIDALPLFFALRTLNGIAFSLISTSIGAIIADLVPDPRLGEGVSFYSISSTLSSAFGPAAGMTISRNLGFAALMNFCMVLGALGLLCAIFVSYERKTCQREPAGKQMRGGSVRSASAAPTSADPTSALYPLRVGKKAFALDWFYPSIVLMFLAISLGLILTYVPLLGSARNINAISLFFTVYAVGLLIIRIITARLSDRIHPSYLFFPAASAMIVSVICLAFSFSLFLVVIAACAYGLGMGIAQPLLNTLQIKMIPADKRGLASAAYFSAMDLGVTLGSIGFGLVLDYSGFTFIFLLCVPVLLFSLLLYYFTLRNYKYKTGKPG